VLAGNLSAGEVILFSELMDCWSLDGEISRAPLVGKYVLNSHDDGRIEFVLADHGDCLAYVTAREQL
jgi:hypothetical protein